MEMPGRTGMMDRYRFGFNGKENDREWGTAGLTQDYGMRLYNPAVGRFLSVDPLFSSYPWYTPYQFAGNKPIRYIDLDGTEEAESESEKYSNYISPAGNAVTVPSDWKPDYTTSTNVDVPQGSVVGFTTPEGEYYAGKYAKKSGSWKFKGYAKRTWRGDSYYYETDGAKSFRKNQLAMTGALTFRLGGIIGEEITLGLSASQVLGAGMIALMPFTLTGDTFHVITAGSGTVLAKIYDKDILRAWNLDQVIAGLVYRTNRDKEKVRVYKLVTDENGAYFDRHINVKDGTFNIMLEEGAIYKYGVEKVGTTRYSKTELQSAYGGKPLNKVYITGKVPRLAGEAIQNGYIINYAIQHGGRIPPGNTKIF